jgi:hypothetical protein
MCAHLGNDPCAEAQKDSITIFKSIFLTFLFYNISLFLAAGGILRYSEPKVLCFPLRQGKQQTEGEGEVSWERKFPGFQKNTPRQMRCALEAPGKGT